MSGGKVAKNSDMWLGSDGGYIMPRDGVFAKKLRKAFEELRTQYDDSSLTPVYLEKGVFVFDFYVEPLCPLGSEEKPDEDMSGNSRQPSA